MEDTLDPSLSGRWEWRTSSRTQNLESGQGWKGNGTAKEIKNIDKTDWIFAGTESKL